MKIRKGIAGLCVAIAALAVIALPAGAQAGIPAAVASPAADSPIARFGSCIAGGGEGDILLLIDKSASLVNNDPQNDRVTAARYLVRQLASFAESTGATVNVKVATFGDSYTAESEWASLDALTISSISKSVDSLVDEHNGFDTDYWTALESSRRDLAEKAASRDGGVSCQSIAWFTDGNMDYQPRTSQKQLDAYGESKQFAPEVVLNSESNVTKVLAAATKQLCRDGGLADQLRSSHISVFAIGLQSEGDAGDFGFLNAVATGTDQKSGTDCGAITDPVPGTFTLASNIDELLFAFDAIGTLGTPPITQETGVCAKEFCTDESHQFVLDASTGHVHILATSNVDGLEPVLVSPAGVEYALERSATGTAVAGDSPGWTVEHTWQSDHTLEVDLAMSPDSADWTGLWNFAFVDPTGKSKSAKSQSSIRISSDYRPTILNLDDVDLHAGDSVTGVQPGLIDADGATLDTTALLGTVAFSAVLTDSAGTEVVLADNLTAEELAKPLSFSLADARAGAGTIVLELGLTTAPILEKGSVKVPGTQLEPQSVTIPLTIAPPVDFPSVASTVNFGVLDGNTTATTTVPVSGSGCVWFDGKSPVAITAAPEKVGNIVVSVKDATTAGECLSSPGEVVVTLAIDENDNGSINGTFEIMTAPTGQVDRAIPATVSFTADVRRPIDAANFLASLVVALILGPGIPIALLYLFKWLFAKIPSRALSAERIVVSISDGRVLRNGSSFALAPTDFRDIVGVRDGGVRSLDVAGVSLTTHTGAAPTGAGFVVASVPGTVSASGAYPSSNSKHQARLPLAVQNQWVVIRTPGSAEGAAEVVVIVSADAPMERKLTIVDDINARLPDVYARLLEQTGDSAGEPTGPATGFGTTESPQGSGFGSFESGAPSAPSSTGYSGFGFADDSTSGNPGNR